MSTPPSPPADAGAAVALSAWLRLSDELITGLHHALNNRLAALSAVAQVLEAEMPESHPLRGALGRESERLRATVALLSLLPREQSPGPEPVQVDDALGRALELYQVHHDLRDLPCTLHVAPNTLPLWAEPERLTHALLMLMTAAAHQVRHDAQGEVRVTCVGTLSEVTIRVEAHGAGEEQDAAVVGGYHAGAEALLAEVGGSVALEEGSPRGRCFRVDLPTLPEVRRREREGRGS